VVVDVGRKVGLGCGAVLDSDHTAVSLNGVPWSSAVTVTVVCVVVAVAATAAPRLRRRD
jgi:hypothetical protein